MLAIYKKELRSYFTSMTGYVCIAFMLVVIGIYYTVINLASGYPYFGYTLSCVLILFLLLTPVLTMRVFAEESNRRTDQMLFTAPIPLWKVVIGKYLAMLSVFGVAIIITCFYPIIMAQFGTVSMPMAYSAILGYFLYGATCIAIGLFLSSVTDSQIIAALLTFFVVLVFYISSIIANALPGTAIANFLIWAVVIIFATWLIYAYFGSFKLALGAGLVAVIVDIVIYFAKAGLMAGSVANVVSAFDMTEPFANFASGIFDVNGLVYYLGIIIFCVFLTIQSIQRRRWGGDALTTVVLLAIIIVANLLVNQLPVKYTQFDLTDNQLYSISDETKEYLAGLTDDIEMYLIAQSGNEDDYVLKIMQRYEDLSEHITVKTKDPVVYPTFVSQYTDSTVSENSVIVVCGDRAKVIDYDDILEYEFDYYTYSESYSYDAEGELTSAIDYVTSEDLPKLYTLTGHSEASFSDTLSSQISKENIEVCELSLVLNDAVPDDADCVFINAPQTDISSEELEMLLDYLENGGDIILVTDYTGEETPNLDALLESYGMSRVDGLVFEGNSQYYYPGYPAYLIPRINTSDATGSLSSDDLVLIPYAQAISVSESLRSSLTVTEILTTSSKAYIKTDIANITTIEKESGDEEGSFYLAAVALEEYDGITSRLIYVTSSALLDESTNSVVSGNNYQLLMNMLSYLIDKEESIAIPAKSMDVEYLTVTAGSAGFWGSIAVLLPVIIMITGGVIWFRRRRR